MYYIEACTYSQIPVKERDKKVHFRSRLGTATQFNVNKSSTIFKKLKSIHNLFVVIIRVNYERKSNLFSNAFLKISNETLASHIFFFTLLLCWGTMNLLALLP